MILPDGTSPGWCNEDLYTITDAASSGNDEADNAVGGVQKMFKDQIKP